MAGKPQLVLKPRIIAGFLPRFLVTALILGVSLLGVAVFVTLIATGKFALPALAALLGLDVFVSAVVSYMNLQSREYRFFSDRVEVYEGFLNLNHYIVRYDRVTNISLEKPVWQRLWHTGSIFVNTAGTVFNELQLSYIPNPDRIFYMVRSHVRRYTGRTPTVTDGS